MPVSLADLEARLTGRALAWVGGLALVLGAIFFLSLAFTPRLDRTRGARRHRPHRRCREPRGRRGVHGSPQPPARACAHARRPGDHLDQPRRRDEAVRPHPGRARPPARARQLDRGGRDRGPREFADRGRVRAHRRARGATAPRGHARRGHPRLRGRRARRDDRRRAVAVVAVAADRRVPACRSPARQLDHGRARRRWPVSSASPGSG